MKTWDARNGSDKPICVEAVRNRTVESVHAVDLAVCDTDGKLVVAHGAVDRPVFPRSSVKALQALPLLESGAADHFRLDDEKIALACSSHSSEPRHVERVAQMLALAGLDEACLECGAQLPRQEADRAALIWADRPPSAIHNTCSGKHAGFLVYGSKCGMEAAGYSTPDHPIQKKIARTLTETTGAAHVESNRAIDGCSIPTWAIPLKNLAAGFALLAAGNQLAGDRQAAMQRIRDACVTCPEMVAGSDRFDTDFMRAMKGRAFVKSGAEGVFTAALPELGLGLALKCRDGAERASEVVIANAVLSFLQHGDGVLTPLERFTQPKIRNVRGTEVGTLKIS